MNYMFTWKKDFFSFADATKTAIIDKYITQPHSGSNDDRLVNECWQFREQVRLITALKKRKYPDISQLICERTLIEVFLNLVTILKMHMTLPRISCEPGRNFA